MNLALLKLNPTGRAILALVDLSWPFIDKEWKTEVCMIKFEIFKCFSS